MDETISTSNKLWIILLYLYVVTAASVAIYFDSQEIIRYTENHKSAYQAIPYIKLNILYGIIATCAAILSGYRIKLYEQDQGVTGAKDEFARSVIYFWIFSLIVSMVIIPFHPQIEGEMVMEGLFALTLDFLILFYLVLSLVVNRKINVYWWMALLVVPIGLAFY